MWRYVGNNLYYDNTNDYRQFTRKMYMRLQKDAGTAF